MPYEPQNNERGHVHCPSASALTHRSPKFGAPMGRAGRVGPDGSDRWRGRQYRPRLVRPNWIRVDHMCRPARDALSLMEMLQDTSGET
jgi:hypothetical protein